MPIIEQQDIVTVSAAGTLQHAIDALKAALLNYPPVRVLSVQFQPTVENGSDGYSLTALLEAVHAMQMARPVQAR